MIIKNAFPIKLYTFNCSKELLDKTIYAVKNIEYKPRGTDGDKNWSSKESILKNNKFSELFEWFHECIEQARLDIKYHFKLKITVGWVNKNSHQGGGHHLHTHPNSLLDGVFYLTSSDQSKKIDSYNPQHFLFKKNETVNCCPGDTIFCYQDIWKDNIFFSPYESKGLKYIEKAEAGKLILFPSNLFHGVVPYNNEFGEERYTIAFNSFPCGDLSRDSRGLDVLNIDLK